MQECLINKLFGLPAQHWAEPGLPLFLFNYSDRSLHGIFEAASSGKQYIDSNACTEDGSERTKYPAQVQMITRLQCQVLHEKRFKSIIIDTYYTPSHFCFELDHDQERNLSSKLSTLVGSSRTVIPRNPTFRKAVQNLPSESKHDESRVSDTDLANGVVDSVGISCNFDDAGIWLETRRSVHEFPFFQAPIAKFHESSLSQIRIIWY